MLINEDPVVYIVDDSDSVRDALSLLMKSVGLKAACFSLAQEFLSGYKPAGPGCLVLDVRMPGMSGLELQQLVVAKKIPLPVIMITGHGDVSMAVRAMRTGAMNFFEKPFNDQALLDCIHESISQSKKMLGRTHRSREIISRLKKLSDREREVLDLIVSGRFSKAIGAHLGISSKTVDVHRKNILDKMQVKTPVEVVRLLMSLDVDYEDALAMKVHDFEKLGHVS